MRLTAPDPPIRDRFARANELSIYWRNCATDLHGSAAAIWVSKDSDVERVIIERASLYPGYDFSVATPFIFRMLCGLSLELIFKAILVARRVTVPKVRHDLLDLADRANVEYTTKRDRGLLELLSIAITWMGRYPVPKKRAEWDRMLELQYEHIYAPVERDGKKTAFIRPTGALNWDGYNRLWAKALAAHDEARKHEPDDD